jgi:hypothetical protein
MLQVRFIGIRDFIDTHWRILQIISSATSAVVIMVSIGSCFSTRNEAINVIAPDGLVNLSIDRKIVWALSVARCLDMIRVLGRVPLTAVVTKTIGSVVPAISGQAVVVLTIMHVFAWAAMLCWGGLIDPLIVEHAPISWVDTPSYALLNFNSYRCSMFTLFVLLVVNNWNLIAAGYA